MNKSVENKRNNIKSKLTSGFWGASGRQFESGHPDS
jgi:hypothetical protein